MRTLNGILWLVTPGLLLLLVLSCRPVAQADAPVRANEDSVPAQVNTPTPTIKPTATPTTTPVSSSTPEATPSPTPGPTYGPEPRPTYPPNIKLSVPPPPPPPPRRTFPPPRTREEADALIEQLRKEEGLKPLIILKTEGPTTAGANIKIAGKVIKLPSDAYIGSRIVGITCGKELCLKAPIYTIVRGKSKITFSSQDGQIGSETIGQSEEHAFDFLRGYLKK